jgi:hypothetical protein
MIAVGLVEGGIELDGTWVSEVGIDLVERLQFEDHPAASISLVYLIPGSITSPGFEGFRLGRIKKGPPAWLEARIGVPAAELESDRLPDLLLDMAEEAIAAASARFEKAGIALDPAHRRHVDDVRLSLASRPIERPLRPHSPTKLQVLVEQIEREIVAERGEVESVTAGESTRGPKRPAPTQRLTVSLALRSPMGEQEELQRLFAFEDVLEALCRGSDGAELEGNEIGDGAFTLFIVCRSAAKTWAQVEPLIGDLGSVPGSFVELEGPGLPRHITLPPPT